MHIWDLVLGVLMFNMCGTDFTEGKGQRSANGNPPPTWGDFNIRILSSNSHNYAQIDTLIIPSQTAQ